MINLLLKNKFFISFILIINCLTALAFDKYTYVSVELAQTWQSKNDQRIPGKTGDDFSLTDFSKGPFFTNRLYLGHRWSPKHEIRALYAPLEIDLNSSLSKNTRFINSTFLANTPTQAYYKFNSYRITYAYFLEPQDNWQWAFGFTAKIRDAEVKLKQGSLVESKSNIGFVPLAHVRGSWNFSKDWEAKLDLDGLAAPQGRAIDLGLFVQHNLPSQKAHVFFGYRTVEGGADNDEVYNFSWFHSATAGLSFKLD